MTIKAELSSDSIRRSIFRQCSKPLLKVRSGYVGLTGRSFTVELLRMVAAFNAPQGLKDFISQNPIRPGRDSASGRAALERRTIHIPDVVADRRYWPQSAALENRLE